MLNVKKYKWKIIALLFFATTINYVDRQVLGIMAPHLQDKFHWSDSQYGLIVTSFQVAYALGFLFIGNMVDKVGTRIGYTISIIFWSIAGILHCFAQSAVGFAAARFGLGLGEAGNFPCAVKVVAEWFPRKERALATGIFVSGSSIGAMIAPLAVPVIALRYGWQAAFLFTGLSGFIWLLFWLMTYRSPDQHKKLSNEDLGILKMNDESKNPKKPWIELLKYRQTWAFAIGKLFTDPVFSFFFFFCQSSFTRNMVSPLQT